MISNSFKIKVTRQNHSHRGKRDMPPEYKNIKWEEIKKRHKEKYENKKNRKNGKRNTTKQNKTTHNK